MRGETRPEKQQCAYAVLTDNRMPNMSGIDFLKLQQSRGCKALESNKAVMSASLNPNEIADVEGLGVHYFKKPFKIKELKKWIDECSERLADDRVLASL